MTCRHRPRRRRDHRGGTKGRPTVRWFGRDPYCRYCWWCCCACHVAALPSQHYCPVFRSVDGAQDCWPHARRTGGPCASLLGTAGDCGASSSGEGDSSTRSWPSAATRNIDRNPSARAPVRRGRLMAPRVHLLSRLLALSASLICAEAAARPTWVRRTQGVSLPFCGLSDIGCAGDTPSCDCVTFMFRCDLTTSGCTPLTWGTSILVVGTVTLLLCCCCGGSKSGGYEGALAADLLRTYPSPQQPLRCPSAIFVLATKSRIPLWSCRNQVGRGGTFRNKEQNPGQGGQREEVQPQEQKQEQGREEEQEQQEQEQQEQQEQQSQITTGGYAARTIRCVCCPLHRCGQGSWGGVELADLG